MFAYSLAATTKWKWKCRSWIIKMLRDDFKKKKIELFDDIDQIAFNTHPPPPKDDIWKND